MHCVHLPYNRLAAKVFFAKVYIVIICETVRMRFKSKSGLQFHSFTGIGEIRLRRLRSGSHIRTAGGSDGDEAITIQFRTSEPYQTKHVWTRCGRVVRYPRYLQKIEWCIDHNFYKLTFVLMTTAVYFDVATSLSKTVVSIDFIF